MSLNIQEESVQAVLLDKWYPVIESTFVLDAYEFSDEYHLSLKGGQEKLISATGFFFATKLETEDGVEYFNMFGPITSIKAVKTNSSDK